MLNRTDLKETNRLIKLYGLTGKDIKKAKALADAYDVETLEEYLRSDDFNEIGFVDADNNIDLGQALVDDPHDYMTNDDFFNYAIFGIEADKKYNTKTNDLSYEDYGKKIIKEKFNGDCWKAVDNSLDYFDYDEFGDAILGNDDVIRTDYGYIGAI